MSGPDHETFETITRREEDRRRAELIDDYGNENADRDAGRMKRHLPGEAAPDAIRKRRDEDARRMMSALEQLLLDPVYRAKYEAFGLFLSDAETKADKLIEKAEAKLAEIDTKISAAIESAPKLNGKAIFRFADGRVIDEDGNELTSDQVEGIVWPDGSMSAEEFATLRESREQANATLMELRGFRTDLGQARDRYEDHENPITPDEMEGYERQIDDRLNNFEARNTPQFDDQSATSNPPPPNTKITL